MHGRCGGRQLGDIRRDPSRLILGEELGRYSVLAKGTVAHRDVMSKVISNSANGCPPNVIAKTFLPLERKRRLDAIGFVWDWIDQRWEYGFTALLKFKRREGHCQVPIFHKE